MSERSQRKDKSSTVYFHEKVKLCHDVSFEDTKEQVLVGLLFRDWCASVASKDHYNIDDLLHDITDLERLINQKTERIRNQKDEPVPKKNSSTISSTQEPAEEKKSQT